VYTSAGAPASGGRLRISRGDGLFGVTGSAVELTGRGRFALAGVSPGTYFLHFSEGPWPPPRDVAIPLISATTVIVGEGDAENIRVLPIRMVRGTGRVIVDPALRSQFRPGDFTVGATPVDFEGNPGPSRPGAVRDDLTFEFRAWPGVARVRVMPETRDWFIKSVRRGGVDVTRSGIDFRGEEISGLEIELVRR
jgi:hypothetical protein